MIELPIDPPPNTDPSPYCANCGSCGEPDCCRKCCSNCELEKYFETFDEIREVGHVGGLGLKVYYGVWERDIDGRLKTGDSNGKSNF